jgi:hypothetical protein
VKTVDCTCVLGLLASRCDSSRAGATHVSKKCAGSKFVKWPVVEELFAVVSRAGGELG